MFVVSLTYVESLEKVDELIPGHIDYLKKYYALNKFLASGRKTPRTGGIILASTESREELDSILKEDPFYISGVATYDVPEFTPTMTIEALEALKSYG